MTPTSPRLSSHPTIPRIPSTSTTPGPVPDSAGLRPIAARVALTAILGYQVLSVAAIVANPQWNPLTRQLSEYVLGHEGWLQVAAFLASAVSYAALFVALRPRRHGVAGRIGLGILLYCALATIGVGTFITDPMTTPPDAVSVHGIVHIVFGLSALVGLPIAALLLSRSVAYTHPDRTPSRRALGWLGFLPLAGFTLIWIPEVAGLIPAGGWPDRVLFLTYTAWVLTVAALPTPPVRHASSKRGLNHARRDDRRVPGQRARRRPTRSPATAPRPDPRGGAGHHRGDQLGPSQFPTRRSVARRVLRHDDALLLLHRRRTTPGAHRRAGRIPTREGNDQLPARSTAATGPRGHTRPGRTAQPGTVI